MAHIHFEIPDEIKEKLKIHLPYGSITRVYNGITAELVALLDREPRLASLFVLKEMGLKEILKGLKRRNKNEK